MQEQTGNQSPRPTPAYPEEARRRLVSRVLAGESASAIAKETGVGQPTISRWVREYHIKPGGDLNTVDELMQLKQRVKSLESYISRLERALLSRVLETETREI